VAACKTCCWRRYAVFECPLVFSNFIYLQATEAQFKIRINERGNRFNEEIKIDERSNTVSFMVPKHNNVDRSEVLNDFTLV
jgi:hypothetical protein